MKILEAIMRADSLRPNTLREYQKYAWASDLDGQIAEMMGLDAPASTFPEDRELLMPPPYEEIYQLYLVAKIDYYNNEIDMYTNDLMVYEEMLAEAKAWWRRNNKPPHRGNWNLFGMGGIDSIPLSKLKRAVKNGIISKDEYKAITGIEYTEVTR